MPALLYAGSHRYCPEWPRPPICPHLNLSSTFILRKLKLDSISILEESCYVDRCTCHTRPKQPPQRLISRCRSASPLPPLSAVPRQQQNRLLPASNPSAQTRQIHRPYHPPQHHQEPGDAPTPHDPAWLTHTSSPLALHHATIAWQAYAAQLPHLRRLRRQWLKDLTPHPQKIQGQLLDGAPTHPLASEMQRQKSYREHGYWAILCETWRQEREWRRTKRLVK
jgi:hypothetical protein